MTGRIENGDVILPIPFRLQPCGRIPAEDRTIEFVVDTGFAGALTLPYCVANLLILPCTQEGFARPDDITSSNVYIYHAVIVWNGAERRVRIVARDGQARVGRELLTNYPLAVEGIKGGAVHGGAL